MFIPCIQVSPYHLIPLVDIFIDLRQYCVQTLPSLPQLFNVAHRKACVKKRLYGESGNETSLTHNPMYTIHSITTLAII